MEPGQTVAQPEPVDPVQGGHIRHSADAKQITAVGQGCRIVLAEAAGQQIGQTHPRQIPVGGPWGG